MHLSPWIYSTDKLTKLGIYAMHLPGEIQSIFKKKISIALGNHGEHTLGNKMYLELRHMH